MPALTPTVEVRKAFSLIIDDGADHSTKFLEEPYESRIVTELNAFLNIEGIKAHLTSIADGKVRVEFGDPKDLTRTMFWLLHQGVVRTR